MTTNPLLDFSDLPRFAAIKPEHVTPALDVLLAEARAAVEQVIAAGGDDWDSVSEPLSDATERLGRAWGVVGHLNSVMGNTEGLREVYNAEIPRISAFFTELGQNLDLYARFKAVAANPEAASTNLFSGPVVAISSSATRPVPTCRASMAIRPNTEKLPSGLCPTSKWSPSR